MSRKSLYILLGSLSSAGYGWLAWNSVHSHITAPGICIFKTITHLPCPSCGATRAILLLLGGDVRGSLLLNPLGAVLFFALAVIPVWLLIDTFLGQESLHLRYTEMESLLREKSWISIPLIVLVVVNWFWNIAKGL